MFVEFLCLMITLSSLTFVLSILGLAADSLLNSKFDFLRRRIPIPQDGHVVIVGEGRVAQRVAAVLRDVRQPFLFLANPDNPDVPHTLDLNAPIVYQPVIRGLNSVHLDRAKSVILATGNQMLNLEAALVAKHIASQAAHHLDLVIRTNNQRFSNHLNTLLPDARNFCIYALSADAFVGAAFGENILSLFRLENSTILVTEFVVEAGDTLQAKLLSQVSYGYGVVPIYHEPANRQPGQDSNLRLMPPEETILEVGDRLVLLATINGLRRIESGTLAARRRWQLQAVKPLDPRSSHYAGDILTNISGCSLSQARNFMKNLPEVLKLPGVMELELYDHQAYTLVQKLRKLLPIRLVSIPVADEAVRTIDWLTCDFQIAD
jgi:Trk K+ transport system NAD-binding subunit